VEDNLASLDGDLTVVDGLGGLLCRFKHGSAKCAGLGRDSCVTYSQRS
jgi:hypothetical protein